MTRMVLFPDPHSRDPDAWFSSVQGWNRDITACETNADLLPGAGVLLEGDAASARDSPLPDDALGVWLTSNPIEMRIDDTYLE